jgi:hypothetical protein
MRRRTTPSVTTQDLIDQINRDQTDGLNDDLKRGMS